MNTTLRPIEQFGGTTQICYNQGGRDRSEATPEEKRVAKACWGESVFLNVCGDEPMYATWGGG